MEAIKIQSENQPWNGNKMLHTQKEITAQEYNKY